MEIDIKHIAKLARLGLTSSEEHRFSKEMEEILQFITKLEEVDTKGMEPVAHAVGIQNVYREDEAVSVNNYQENLLSQAPDREDNYVKVKKILEK